MTSRLGIVVGAVIWLAAAGYARGQAADVRTVDQGVYTEPQATKGAGLFHTHCERCHLADLGGDQLAPALVGEGFLRQWQGTNLGSMFSTIKSSMPPDVPRTATDDEYAAIVSYLLKMNQFPAGAADLSKDPVDLEQILFKASLREQSSPAHQW